MVEVVYGSAHLYGLASDADSERLLSEAWECGIRRFDTAPSYGHGRSEPAVGELARRHPDLRSVTTKTGIEAVSGPRGLRRAAATVAKRLPSGLQDRLRGAANRATLGRFDAGETERSIDRSLARLGRIDRLLLHEVHPDDISDELLAVLARRRDAGDVGEVGVATQNELTGPALARAPDLLRVAHVSVGLLHPPVELPATLAVRVGHGLLGNGGEHVRRLQAVMAADPALGAAWSAVTDGGPWSGPGGLARALLARAARLELDEVIVSTTRPGAVASSYGLAAGHRPLEPSVLELLERAARPAGLPPAG